MYYALKGRTSGKLVSWGGRLIIHDNKGEMQFLFEATSDAYVVPVNVNPDPEKTIALWAVPGMEAVEWPLRKEDFR